MSDLSVQYFIFFLSMLFGILMLYEGVNIVMWKKEITPLPTRILYWLGIVLFGKEKSESLFIRRASARDLRVYATYVLSFGAILILSGFVYIFNAV